MQPPMTANTLSRQVAEYLAVALAAGLLGIVAVFYFQQRAEVGDAADQLEQDTRTAVDEAVRED